MDPSDKQRGPAALIIGAGIAGIQAALDIADAGFQVYLVEREPSVGGRMAQLDKTFPTLDCSSCILTPKMVDVGRHPNIKLLTYSEVEWVKREDGRFRVRVRKKARSVDEEKCTGCGVCTEHCIVRNAPYIEGLVRGLDGACPDGSTSSTQLSRSPRWPVEGARPACPERGPSVRSREEPVEGARPELVEGEE